MPVYTPHSTTRLSSGKRAKTKLSPHDAQFPQKLKEFLSEDLMSTELLSVHSNAQAEMFLKLRNINHLFQQNRTETLTWLLSSVQGLCLIATHSVPQTAQLSKEDVHKSLQHGGHWQG